MSPLAGFHFHFYQPPRDNPWVGSISNEWSAWPYHDWNERIAAECYRAMVAVALAREDATYELYEPLAHSSFNVGPTLHHWLRDYARDVDQVIRHEVSERASSSSANVMAMPLVHAILPLAHREDALRLIAWGIQDYRYRYGVEPTGMWLPETAVDVATLDMLVDQGITYTVLMPTQATQVRASADSPWVDVTPESLDTSRAYFVQLPSGRTINVVFGHYQLSQQVAFGDLINDGTHLADVMVEAAGGDDGAVLLVADGETYGHHHRFGDVGIAWALRRLERHHHVTTALGEWLDGQEVTHEVALASVSAWSCAHGVERWNSDCGCVTGERPGYDLAWRRPLRQALDDLRESLGEVLDFALSELVVSPRSALDAYGNVIVGAHTRDEFIAAHQGHELSSNERIQLLELCEAYRNLVYAFTSCAWFFADPAAIETCIVLRYAALSMELTARATGLNLEDSFVAALSNVHSAQTDLSGEALWRRAVSGSKTSASVIAAGAVAEWHVHGSFTHHARGYWNRSATRNDDATWRVVVENSLTGRLSEFQAQVLTHHARGLSITLQGGEKSVEYDLPQLGSDVIARVATGWLQGVGSHDYEGALNSLAAELLTRPGTRDDDAMVMALASAPRCVSPSGEAAARRALLALSSQGLDEGRQRVLLPLAHAVGLSELFGERSPEFDFH